MLKSTRTWIASLALAVVAMPAIARADGEAKKDLPGPIDSLQDLQDSGKMLFKLADENNDGQISQKEATDAGNLLVGGFFFRADANGDGTLTHEEAIAARDAFMRDKPWVKYVIDTVKSKKAQAGQSTNTAEDSLRGILSVVDTNNDKQLQAAELRQAVQTTVQSVFATADTNRDGQLSPTEVNAAIAGAGKSAAQAVFQEADADNNGSISEAEFNKALLKPAQVVFAVMDLNHDGQITQEEAQRARKAVMRQIEKLTVPEPANSARHLIHSGRAPSDVAPVPTFNVPKPVQATPSTAPAPRP